MYVGKTKYKRWTIKEKNEIALLYLDGHMSCAQILKDFNISHKSILYQWIEQYRKYGTCIDNRGKCTKAQNPNKGRPRKNLMDYHSMSKEELIKELEFRDELKNFLVYLNQQNKDTK